MDSRSDGHGGKHGGKQKARLQEISDPSSALVCQTSDMILNQKYFSLATRWDELADEARKTDLGSHTLPDLANSVEMNWYHKRGAESLSGFLELTGQQLFQIHGFGKTKVRRLSKIVELHLNHPEYDQIKTESKMDLTRDSRATLKEWEIPLEFPIKLIALPIRILNFCSTAEITDTEGLIALWEKLGFEGLKLLPNLGRKSVGELQKFMMALKHRNVVEAGKFLPLCQDGAGLSAGQALIAVVRDLNDVEKALLDRRIMDGLTLEQSAEARGLTRERVRQIERDYLRKIHDVFDYFENDVTRMIDIWVDGGSCLNHLAIQAKPENSSLLVATINRIFEYSPRGVAKALADEENRDGWLENLRNSECLWFGGVDIADFLREYVEKENEAEFFTHLIESREFKIDHGAKLISPAKTNLTASIRGILRTEENPIPLTWLIVLLEETGMHPNLVRNDLLRRRKAWNEAKTFPKEKILWNQ